MEGLDAKDLSRTLPGDLLEVQDGEHQKEFDDARAQAGGSAAQGDGGDRVWKESLLPEEQAALEQFFRGE